MISVDETTSTSTSTSTATAVNTEDEIWAFGNASTLQEVDFDDDSDDLRGDPIDPETVDAIRSDPEFIAWKERLIRSLIEAEGDVRAGLTRPMDDVVDEVLRDIENGTL